MNPNVFRLNTQFDLDKVKSELEKLRSICPFHPLANQLCLTHRPGAVVPFYDGVGGPVHLVDGEWVRVWKETDHSEFNATLKGGYLYEVYRRTLDVVQKPLGRTRFMRLMPKSCYSFHCDFETRVHLPVITNDQCYMAFENGTVHLPADGHLYVTNTVAKHTAFNGSDFERIHLVFAVEAENLDFLRT